MLTVGAPLLLNDDPSADRQTGHSCQITLTGDAPHLMAHGCASPALRVLTIVSAGAGSSTRSVGPAYADGVERAGDRLPELQHPHLGHQTLTPV